MKRIVYAMLLQLKASLPHSYFSQRASPSPGATETDDLSRFKSYRLLFEPVSVALLSSQASGSHLQEEKMHKPFIFTTGTFSQHRWKFGREGEGGGGGTD